MPSPGAPGRLFRDADPVGDSGNGGDEPCGIDLPHGSSPQAHLSFLLDYGVPAFTADVASSDDPVFKRSSDVCRPPIVGAERQAAAQRLLVRSNDLPGAGSVLLNPGGIPELPLTGFPATFIVALRCELAIFMEITPEAMLNAVLVVALRGDGTVWMVGHERTLPYPSGAIRSEITAVSELDTARLVSDLSDFQLCSRLANYTESGKRMASRRAAE
jgi:hypothetical protein